MKREALIEKGYSEEQVTELLDMFHKSNDEAKKMQTELDRLKGIETQFQNTKKELDDINKSKMTAQEQIEADKKEAAELKAKSQRIYNTAKAKEILAGYDVDESLIDNLVNVDEQSTIASANALKSLLDSKIETTTKKVREELSNLSAKPEPSNVPPTNDTMTKEKFDKLTMSEQKEWKDAHLDEYHQFYPQK